VSSGQPSVYEFLEQSATKDLLRFSTVGSVDDGKSTLIGRLLYDTKCIYDDHLHALKADSIRVGTGPEVDFALLTDGLKAEREQKITIDVAYRYFSTPNRNFIIADTPGHEQYTRNMATGASTANLAIILIDARHGILTVLALPAPSRAARDRARATLGRLIEVHVSSEGAAACGYEPPLHAEVEVVFPDPRGASAGADRVFRTLELLGFLPRETAGAYSVAMRRRSIWTRWLTSVGATWGGW